MYQNLKSDYKGFIMYLGKFEKIEKLKEYGFSDSELLDMLIYWLDITDLENCIDDFLNDRDLTTDDDYNVGYK